MQGRMIPVALALLAGTAACAGDNREVVDPVFTAAITGAVTRPAVGTATFGVLEDSDIKGFTVVMEDAYIIAIVLQTPSLEQPAPGTYPIVPKAVPGTAGDFHGVVRYDYYKYGSLQQFEAVSGTVNVIESGREVIKGTMTFRAVRTSPCCDQAPVTIDVTGTFTAGQVPVTALR